VISTVAPWTRSTACDRSHGALLHSPTPPPRLLSTSGVCSTPLPRLRSCLRSAHPVFGGAGCPAWASLVGPKPALARRKPVGRCPPPSCTPPIARRPRSRRWRKCGHTTWAPSRVPPPCHPNAARVPHRGHPLIGAMPPGSQPAPTWRRAGVHPQRRPARRTRQHRATYPPPGAALPIRSRP
jgi:hypothetical protein